MAPTPPQSGAASGSSAVQAATQQQTQSAIDLADRMETFVTGLKKELRAYGDPDTVGRDVQKLQTYFGNIHDCELQIAAKLGIPWTPSFDNSGGSAGRT